MSYTKEEECKLQTVRAAVNKCTTNMVARAKAELISAGLKALMIRFIVGSNESYTDGEVVQAAIEEEEALTMSINHCLAVLEFKLGHELQHCLSTTSEFGKTIKRLVEFWEDEAKKKGVSLNQSALFEVARFLVNGTEDGRIEEIRSKNNAKFKKLRTWYRGRELFATRADDTLPELYSILNAIHSIACRGTRPIGFDCFNGTVVETMVADCEAETRAAVASTYCKDCMEHVFAVGEKLTNLVIEHCKVDSLDEALINMITEWLKQNQKRVDPVSSGKEMPQTGEGPSVVFNILTDEKPEDKKEQKIAPDTKVITIDLRTKKEPNEESDNETSQNGSGSGKETEEQTEEESNGSSASESEPEKDASEDDASSNQSASSSSDLSDGEDNPSEKAESGKNQEADTQASPVPPSKEENEGGTGGGAEVAHSEIAVSEAESKENAKAMDKMVETAMKEAITEALDDVEASVEADVKAETKKIREAEKRAKEEAADPCKTPITHDEFMELKNGVYADEWLDSFFESQGIWTVDKPLPEHVKRPAAIARRNVERELKNRSTCNARNQLSGKLKGNGVYKVAAGIPRPFSREGEPYKFDGDVYILVDGSGSMSGSKWRNAGDACAMLEHAFKALCGLKIAVFSTRGYAEVVHTTVLNWNERDMVNHSASFFSANRAGGGNMDGVDIRIATKELLKRGKRNKMLIVLSDGAPSDYRYDGYQDVKNAVEEARKAGVYVVSLYFGEGSFVGQMKESYKAMYGSTAIGCSPEELPGELLKAVKKFMAKTR